MPSPRVRQWASFELCLSLGCAGGVVFAAAGTPLPYMLGAMSFTMVAAFAGIPLVMPGWARRCIVPILGVMFGSVLDLGGVPTGSTLAVLAVLVVVYLLATISLGWLFFRRAGYDPVTSYFCAIPGNLSEVVSVAEYYGADIRRIVLAHAARIVVAITAISFGFRYLLGLELAGLTPGSGPAPALADLAILLACAVFGSWAARLVRMPSAPLLGPLIASVAVHAAGLTSAAPPAVLVAGAQIVLGVLVGSRFSGIRPREVAGTLVLSVAWAVLLILVIALYALAASAALGIGFPAMLLASMPGGLAEASALAIAAHLSLGFVTAVQMIRIFCVLVIGPLVIRRLFRSNS